MARLLVATVPLTGHVQPMRLLVRALLARGHDVAWATATKFAPQVQADGAAFVFPRHAPDWDDADVEAAFPVLRGRRGLARVKAQLDAMFIAPAPAQLRDLREACEAFAPDAVLADQAHLGAALLHEATGLPWASLGVSALGLPSVDTAPFGSALPPARDARDHARNRLLNRLVFGALFGGVNRAWRRAREAAGLPGGRASYFDVVSPQLLLQPTAAAFEYPRSDLPPQVHFIGPLVTRGSAGALPPWWDDVTAASRAGRPVVLVTQGTLATAPRELMGPALRALAGEELLVVATTGRPLAGPEEAGLPAWPANARVAPFVPYAALLPHAAAMVTNGGYGGVQAALAHGVPLVVAGGSEEKPEIAARVAWSGAGVDLRTGHPSPRALRRAVHRLLAEPAFRTRAQALAEALARHDAPAEGCALIERLVATRAPVHRGRAHG